MDILTRSRPAGQAEPDVDMRFTLRDLVPFFCPACDDVHSDAALTRQAAAGLPSIANAEDPVPADRVDGLTELLSYDMVQVIDSTVGDMVVIASNGWSALGIDR